MQLVGFNQIFSAAEYLFLRQHTVPCHFSSVSLCFLTLTFLKLVNYGLELRKGGGYTDGLA